MITETRIMEELKAIREELDYIKEHMVDVDTVLTAEEEERLEESLNDFKAKKSTSLADFEKEMKKNVQHQSR